MINTPLSEALNLDAGNGTASIATHKGAASFSIDNVRRCGVPTELATADPGQTATPAATFENIPGMSQSPKPFVPNGL